LAAFSAKVNAMLPLRNAWLATLSTAQEAVRTGYARATEQGTNNVQEMNRGYECLTQHIKHKQD
jgi:hypothetical protein